MTGISLKDRIGSIVRMSGLNKVGSSVCRDEAMEKGSTIDNNSVECCKVTEKRSTVVDNGIRCNKVMEKESIVDNDNV